MSSETKFELESVRRQKSSEVDAMMRLHGRSFMDACRMVALNPTHYSRGGPLIEWLPSPEQINEFSKAMRNGDIVVNGRVKRLTVDREPAKPSTENRIDDAFELAGVIPEDAVKLPAWFTA